MLNILLVREKVYHGPWKKDLYLPREGYTPTFVTISSQSYHASSPAYELASPISELRMSHRRMVQAPRYRQYGIQKYA